ncbi:MAG: hypothetical protein ACYC5J_06435 [Chloroflexota bacterium]
MALVCLLALPGAALADSGSGSVTVTAASSAKFTFTFSTATLSFGTTDPMGVEPPGVSGVDVLHDELNDAGTYYVWKGAGSGLAVAVKSNKAWSGTIAVSAAPGNPVGMDVSAGVLRFIENGTPPATFAAADNATSLSPSPAPGSWQSSHSKGPVTFNDLFLLRVLWTDEPGEYGFTITYTATAA